jgi:subfamily B ATP-binding cassette protein HlyB/CyaB
MNRPVAPEIIAAPVDTGLRAIVGIAGYYRIAADAHQIERELALTGRLSNEDDIIRAARLVGLKARVLRGIRWKRLLSIPTPAILRLSDGSFTILIARGPAGECRIVNPIT